MADDIFSTPIGYAIAVLPVFITIRMFVFFLRYWTHEPIKKIFLAYTLVIITICILYGTSFIYIGIIEYMPVLAVLFLIDLVNILLKIRGFSLPNINDLLAKKKLPPKDER
jgi:hypothetical protein